MALRGKTIGFDKAKLRKLHWESTVSSFHRCHRGGSDDRHHEIHVEDGTGLVPVLAMGGIMTYEVVSTIQSLATAGE